MNAIEVRDVSKTYSDFTLDNVSLSLPTGTILGLVGENGAGKSTIIGLILNTIQRNCGTISVLGKNNQNHDFVHLKNDIGVVLDEAYFPEVMTPKNVNCILKNTFTHWDETLYYNYLSRFHLPINKQFKTFSRGMKMKLAIAAALSHHPKLLILDEATSGLDPVIRDEILDIFNEFTRNESHSILISSHIISDLDKICDYIAFLHKGKLVLFDEKDKLLEKYAIIKMSSGEFDAIPENAVIYKRKQPFGVEALVSKPDISKAFVTEHTNLEDIILFFAKGQN